MAPRSTAAVALLATSAVSAFPALDLGGLLPKPGSESIKGNPLVETLDGLAINLVGNPDPNDPRFSQWQAPGPGDARSPCPGLNSAANHGFLNRNGRNISVPDAIDGLARAMNIGADFSTAIGGAALLTTDNPESLRFDLDLIGTHNFPIEHDMSLAHRDYYFAHDVYDFYQPSWDQVLAEYGDKDEIDIPTASRARERRRHDSTATNPDFTYGPREIVVSLGETALYMQAMGMSATAASAKKAYIRPFFEQNRLPYAEGWRPSTSPITFPSLGAMALQLFSASPNETLPEGLQVGAGTLKDAFEGVNPLTGFLDNVTHPS